jgi:hypothetical protein
VEKKYSINAKHSGKSIAKFKVNLEQK